MKIPVPARPERGTGFSDQDKLVGGRFFDGPEILRFIRFRFYANRFFRWWRRSGLSAGPQINKWQDNQDQFSHGGVGFVVLGAVEDWGCDGGAGEGEAA